MKLEKASARSAWRLNPDRPVNAAASVFVADPPLTPELVEGPISIDARQAPSTEDVKRPGELPPKGFGGNSIPTVDATEKRLVDVLAEVGGEDGAPVEFLDALQEVISFQIGPAVARLLHLPAAAMQQDEQAVDTRTGGADWRHLPRKPPPARERDDSKSGEPEGPMPITAAKKALI